MYFAQLYNGSGRVRYWGVVLYLLVVIVELVA